MERVDLEVRKTVTASVYRISRAAEDVVVLHLRFPASVRAKSGGTISADQHAGRGYAQFPDGEPAA